MYIAFDLSKLSEVLILTKLFYICYCSMTLFRTHGHETEKTGENHIQPQ